MVIWQYELELDMPLLSDDTIVFGTGFVATDLQVDAVAAGFDAFHDGGVGDNVVGVLFSLEHRLEDRVGVAVGGDHNALY